MKVLQFLLRLLPKRYKERIAGNLLDAVEREDKMSEIVSVVLEEIEKGKYDKARGSKFKSTEEEVNNALKKYPHLKPYRIYFLRVCERKRREAGLPV